MIRAILIAALAFASPATAAAQSIEAGREASQFVPVENEPPAELFVDPPLAGPLARGATIIPYRTENFRILPIFGATAVDVSPRAGHLHVSVDDLPWRWADAGDNDAVVVNGLPAGPHKILIELATPEHKVLTGKSVTFVVPASKSETSDKPLHDH
ncbi:hypothetical protein ASE06_05325 [Sphingopyxis sp. Root214]|uniref:DUF6130 family protein n=1 Tax=unclassified Sphingopyxis TaxID=2614943 RepID=UPI0006FC4586|nr:MULTISPECIES: DUF6130 family protein [unclassified Sphingopyxis]KQZ76814.1 hypothetical protein ASD73_02670 [Sphingopyxis sp. Root154]KRC09299.1 hypothetical protein ASE06_05325 [Sphingopyxis sp. Root214]